MALILIVDDEENIRTTLSLGLRAEGFETLQAGTGLEALELLSAGTAVELVLIDLMMPGLSGLEVARQITRSYPQIQVILSSAYHLSRSQLDRSNCGAAGFIPKPYSMRELTAYIREKTETASRRSVKQAG